MKKKELTVGGIERAIGMRARHPAGPEDDRLIYNLAQRGPIKSIVRVAVHVERAIADTAEKILTVAESNEQNPEFIRLLKETSRSRRRQATQLENLVDEADQANIYSASEPPDADLLEDVRGLTRRTLLSTRDHINLKRLIQEDRENRFND